MRMATHTLRSTPECACIQALTQKAAALWLTISRRPRDTPVDIGGNHIADAARRWAVMLDTGTLVFADSDQLVPE
jgi:hypothetical protein